MVLVADEGAVVGYVVLLVTAGAEDPVDLLRIAVAPAERRTGIGGQLLTRRPWTPCAGRTVLLEVAEGNKYAATRCTPGLGFVRDQPAARVLPGGEDAVSSCSGRQGEDGMSSENEPLILGIETSCDETGVGIVRGQTLLADAIASSVEEHARFGGVVPEVASRAHLEAMVPTIRRACETAGIKPSDVDAVAVTSGPGLAGALLVGVAAAKGLALSLEKPLYGVNHLAAHVAVDTLEHGDLPKGCVAMLVSGGHSSLLAVEDITVGVEPMGATIDDAAGEAFDKVARVLGLPFPGGPYVDKAARDGGDRVVRAVPARADQPA